MTDVPSPRRMKARNLLAKRVFSPDKHVRPTKTNFRECRNTCAVSSLHPSYAYTLRFEVITMSTCLKLVLMTLWVFCVAFSSVANAESADDVAEDESSFAGISECPKVPVADAGEDQDVVVGVPVHLDGTGSTGPRCEVVYFWSVIDRPPGSMAQLFDPYSINPTFIPDRAGTYEIELTVSTHPSGVLRRGDPDRITIAATGDLESEADIGRDGGAVGLSDGASVLIPPDALDSDAAVSIEMVSPSWSGGDDGLWRSRRDDLPELVQGYRIGRYVLVSVAEHRLAMGEYPETLYDAGVDPEELVRSTSLERIGTDGKGRVAMQFNAGSDVDAGVIYLVPELLKSVQQIRWHCETMDYEHISAILPECRYTPEAPVHPE